MMSDKKVLGYAVIEMTAPGVLHTVVRDSKGNKVTPPPAYENDLYGPYKFNHAASVSFGLLDGLCNKYNEGGVLVGKLPEDQDMELVSVVANLSRNTLVSFLVEVFSDGTYGKWVKL